MKRYHLFPSRRFFLSILAFSLAFGAALSASEKAETGPVRGDSGSLVDSGTVLELKGASLSGWMRLLSLPLLSLAIDTSFLSRQGYAVWHDGILDRMADVEASAITYRSEAVLGEPETQSGMVFLPAGYLSSTRPLTWIVYVKGTELKRLDVPSRYAGSESRIGAVIASLGYAVWMPDYPGMGVAPGIQTYCDPGSLARSSLDGFAAARSFLALKIEASGRSGADSSDRLDAAAISARASAGTESGRFYVMGYSEGGLAAMSVARAVEEGSLWSETGESAPPSGLSLAGIYAMGAPLDLSRGFRGDMSADTRLGNPAYTLFVLSGYARAHPDLVDPLRIIRADIRESIVPLLGTDRSAEDINRLIAAMRKKNPKDIVASDVLEKDLLAELRADHLSDPLFRALDGARMDSWNPDPLIPLTLAASRKDRTVPYDHSGEAMRRFSAARNASLAGSASLNGAAGGTGAAGPRLLDLASDSHTKAGVEALLFAVMDLDGAEALLEGSTGRTLPPAFAIIRPER